MEINCIKGTQILKVNSKSLVNCSWAFFSYTNLIVVKAPLKNTVVSGENVEILSHLDFLLSDYFWKTFFQNMKCFQILLYVLLVHYTVQPV